MGWEEWREWRGAKVMVYWGLRIRGALGFMRSAKGPEAKLPAQDAMTRLVVPTSSRGWSGKEFRNAVTYLSSNDDVDVSLVVQYVTL